MRHRTGLRAGAIAGFLISMASCAGTDLQEEFRVDRLDEAGSVHFAVVSVAPWADYADMLSPSFKLTAEQALSRVVPSTRILTESVVDSLQGAAAISVRDTASTDGDDEGVEAATPSIAQQQNAGTQIYGKGQPDSESIDIDPMLQYQAATALYQEVQLLNSYVRSAAIDRGYQAYVVRLQVSLVPRARNEPYDAYVTLGFFSGDSTGGAMKQRELPIGDLMGDVAQDTTPKVVPLLVTDDLEATLHSRMVENIRQFAGALSFMSSFIGGAASAQSYQNEFSNVHGRDMNSLLNVSRVSDNTIRVRLGANQQAAASYAMIPRNHNVTMLVMVPEKLADDVEVIASTSLIDAETGEELPERPEAWLLQRLDALAAKYGLGDAGAELHGLMSVVQANDEALFRERLEDHLGADHRALGLTRPLWVELASLLIGSRYARASFDLPESPDVDVEEELFREQAAIVTDDGREFTIAALQGGHILHPADLAATLVLTVEGREIGIASQEAVMRSATSGVQFVFPSLQSLGLSAAATQRGSVKLLVEYGSSSSREFDALYRLPRPAPVPPKRKTRSP